MNQGQIQVRISLTNQLYDYLLGQSSRLGLPVTQVVKHLIVEQAKKEEFPTFAASDRTIKKAQTALQQLDQATEVTDIEEYFNKLGVK